MKITAILLLLVCLALYNCSVLDNMKKLQTKLTNDHKTLKATHERKEANRKKQLVIPFNAMEAAKSKWNNIVAENLKEGKIAREEYEKQYKQAKAERDTIDQMYELNKGLSKYSKSSALIADQLKMMLDSLNLNLSLLSKNYNKGKAERKDENDDAKENYQKTKDTYNKLKKKLDKQQKADERTLKRKSDAIEAEKKRVSTVIDALSRGSVGRRARPAQVRYVRVSNVKSYLQLSEVEVYDERNRNVALRKPAKQSSTGWGGSASRAVDGNRSGNYWSHSTSHTRTPSGWWEVDLQKDVNVKKVTVWNRSDCCANRLSGSVVTLLDKNRNILKHFKTNGNRQQTFSVGKLCNCA